ncbi:hypothetical protein C8Q73DRAFT_461948 [Cubamyces lactineus]|nr:hypothetical protein C8Q73DRAFT_461948 [Cubamyces lactineus]
MHIDSGSESTRTGRGWARTGRDVAASFLLARLALALHDVLFLTTMKASSASLRSSSYGTGAVSVRRIRLGTRLATHQEARGSTPQSLLGFRILPIGGGTYLNRTACSPSSIIRVPLLTPHGDEQRTGTPLLLMQQYHFG